MRLLESPVVRSVPYLFSSPILHHCDDDQLHSVDSNIASAGAIGLMQFNV